MAFSEVPLAEEPKPEASARRNNDQCPIQYPRALADEAETRQLLGAAPFPLAVTEREQRAERGLLAETAQNRLLPSVSRTAMRQTISSGSRGSDRIASGKVPLWFEDHGC